MSIVDDEKITVLVNDEIACLVRFCILADLNIQRHTGSCSFFVLEPERELGSVGRHFKNIHVVFSSKLKHTEYAMRACTKPANDA